MLYEGELMLHSSAQWGTAKVLLFFSVTLFIKLEELLMLETPIALSDLVEIGWCVQCYSSMKDRRRDGWTQTLHLISLLFTKAQVQRQPLEQGPESGGGGGGTLPPPSSISWPLNHSLVSAQWILKPSMQNSTAFTGGKQNATFFLLNCLSVPLVNLAGADVALSLLSWWQRGICLLLLKKGFNLKFFKISSTTPIFVWY